MSTLDERIKKIREMLQTWSTKNRSTSRRLNFSPADIIYGKRVASIIRQTPDHKNNVSDVVSKILREEMLDEMFREWLLEIEISKLRNVVEFSFFHLPPISTAAE